MAGMGGTGVPGLRGQPETGKRLTEFLDGQRPVADSMLQAAEALRGNAPGVHHPQDPARTVVRHPPADQRTS